MERTQEEVIKIFEEKQASAEREIERARAKDCELTPLEKDTKIIKNKAYMEAYEDCIAFLRGCTIVEKKEPKAVQERALLEPLCNKCIKTTKTCPFKRIGSAYEDCSGFEAYPSQELSEMPSEEKIESTIPKAKQEELGIKQDDLKKMLDMPKHEANKPNNSYKYVEELLNDNTKLRQELAQCKDTIVELANEVTTYRKVARDREV